MGIYATKKVVLFTIICVLHLLSVILNTEKLTSATFPTDNRVSFGVIEGITYIWISIGQMKSI